VSTLAQQPHIELGGVGQCGIGQVFVAIELQSRYQLLNGWHYTTIENLIEFMHIGPT
jgi:hypothetical protein